MKTGSSKYHKWRIVKVNYKNKEYYALQCREWWDIITPWYDWFWGDEESCKKRMDILIAHENKNHIK